MRFYITLARSWAVFNVCCTGGYETSISSRVLVVGISLKIPLEIALAVLSTLICCYHLENCGCGSKAGGVEAFYNYDFPIIFSLLVVSCPWTLTLTSFSQPFPQFRKDRKARRLGSWVMQTDPAPRPPPPLASG